MDSARVFCSTRSFIRGLLIRVAHSSPQAPSALRPSRYSGLSVTGFTPVRRFEVERVMGIEPTLAAWEAAVLPLNYTRLGFGLYSPAVLAGNRVAGPLKMTSAP